MKKVLTASVSLILASFVGLTALFGCAKKDDNKDYTRAAATPVSFSADGNYTTEITGADFSGVAQSDVKVCYTTIKEDGLPQNAQAEEVTESNPPANTGELEVVDEPSATETDDYADLYETKEAQITDFSASSSKITLSFCDPQADENRTSAYTVAIESKKIAASVEVQFAQHTLTPNVEYVLSTANEIQITLTLDGEFNETLTKNDISLRGSFEGMTIASVSAAGANLTMQLTGSLKKDEIANLYTDGSIFVSANAIKDANEAVSAKIPVETLSAYLVGEKLEKVSSSYTVPLVLIDCGVDLATLSAGDIHFYNAGEENESDDIAVNTVTKSGDNEVLLTLTVTGAADRNAAAKAIDGKTVKIGSGDGAFEFCANISPASFYPVFDYVEETGGDLRFTLELYAHSGTFSNNLSADSFEFRQGFEGASDVSVTKNGDSVAELKFKIPQNSDPESGLNMDNLNFEGNITIKSGGLKNMWGDVSAEPAQNVRSYSQDSMGKYTLLGSGDVEILKNIVGGFGNTAAGTIASVASGAASAGTAILTILDITGIMPNKTSQTLTLLKEVDEKINSIQDQLNRQSALMQDIQRSIYNSDLSSFDTQIANLNTLNSIVSGFLATAAKDTALGLDFPLSKAELEELQVKEKDSTVRYKYSDPTSQQSAALQEYTAALVQKVLDEEGNNNFKYAGFEDAYQQLVSTYRNVMAQLTKTSDQNPMAIFDKLCSYTFNFSTSAYGTRYAQRLNICNAVEKALNNIALFYGCDFENAVFQNATSSYKTFLSLINDNTSNGNIGQFAVTKQKPTYKENYLTYFYILGRNVVLTDYVVFLNKSNNKWYTGTYRYREWIYYFSDGSINYQTYTVGTPFYTDSSRGVTFERNFGDDEIQEFVRRMNGRTLREELELAGFTGEITKDGMLFKCWQKNDGGYRWLDVRHATCWYAIAIKLDSKTSEQVLRAQEDGGGFSYSESGVFSYCAPGRWCSV